MNKLPDSVTFTLHFVDIQQIDDSLTNDEAREILQQIKKKGDPFDAESIYSWIDYYRMIQNCQKLEGV